MDSAVFDPRSERFKTPWGAVPAGQRVSFALRPERWKGVSRVQLKALFEESQCVYYIEMPWSGEEDGRDIFTCIMETGSYVGLVWYSFLLDHRDGHTEESATYQLTVYDGSDRVPDWFGAGMTYQIFPDRFCRLSVPDPEGMVGGRTVHADWKEEVVFRPNEQGEVRNRDFFGGSLEGVLAKLDDLQAMGVETLYFNPIFEAAENHRYGTGDYDKIDPMLGTNETFERLCSEAHKRGMRVMLDGVFNHVGFVSKYFNGSGEYGEGGAARSKESPYYPWFSFQNWPDRYDAWWGIYSLPAVEETNPDYVEFISGENGVVRRWLRAGADGWRLDVADELPDGFVHAIHEAARAEKADAQIIGEVWEDASHKIAYGKRRKHVLGGHCDGVMNYPLRTALIRWLQGDDARSFVEEMETLRENYPPFAFYSAMNALGTHDTPRILTLLGTDGAGWECSKEEKAASRLSPEQRARALARLKLGFLILFAFPGSPTVYYGDEAGMEGWEDPFNRRTYPWGGEDTELKSCVAALGSLRRTQRALRRGDLSYVAAEKGLLAFTRSADGKTLLAAANNSGETVRFPLAARGLRPLLGCAAVSDGENGCCTVTLEPMCGGIWELE